MPEYISAMAYKSNINNIKLASAMPDLEKALFNKCALIERKRKLIAAQLQKLHNKKTRK